MCGEGVADESSGWSERISNPSSIARDVRAKFAAAPTFTNARSRGLGFPCPYPTADAQFESNQVSLIG